MTEIERLEKIIEQMNDGYAKTDEVVQIMSVFIEAVQTSETRATNAAVSAFKREIDKRGIDFWKKIQSDNALISKNLLKQISKINARINSLKLQHGEDGKTPKRGIDYFTKEDIANFIRLATPVKGRDYTDGLPGENGKPGKKGLMPKHEWSDSELRFQNPDGTWGKWTNLRGPRGFGSIFQGWGSMTGSETLRIRAGSGISITGQGELTISATGFGGNYIAIDGTSTTTAQIPFAEGIMIADTKVIYFGATSDVNAIGKIYNSTDSLNITGLHDDAVTQDGTDIVVLGGDAAQNGADGHGGYVRLKGGTYDATGFTFRSGFTTTGTTIDTFTAASIIGGASIAANNQSDFAVGNDLYVTRYGIFAGGIGVNGKIATTGYALLGSGDTAQIIGLDRRITGAGVDLTVQSGWGQSGGTNLAGGNLLLKAGVAVGNGTANVQVWASGGGSSGTADSNPTLVATFAKTGVTWATNYTHGLINATSVNTSTLRLGNGSKTGNYTITSLDTVVYFDCTSGNLVATLPAISGVNKIIYSIKKTDSSVNTLTITPNGAETIDCPVLRVQGDSVLISNNNGSAWFVLSSNLETSGTYTPTLTNTTNISASTARLCTYARVKDSVTVSGQFDIDPTAAGAVLLGISLPIASALTTAYQLGGVASSTGTTPTESAGIEADATNDRASVKYVAADLSNHTMTFTFTYQLL